MTVRKPIVLVSGQQKELPSGDSVPAADAAPWSGITGKPAVISAGADAATARAAIGLGDAATKSVGTTSGTVAAGDDSRLLAVADKANKVETTATITDGGSVTLSPANGGIQKWMLGANRTPAASFSDGEGMVLMVDDGTAYTITWTTAAVTWCTSDGNPPTLKTSGYTVIVLWKVGSVIYGK